MTVGGQRNFDRPKRCFLSEKSTDPSSRIVLVLAYLLGKAVANRSTTLVIFFVFIVTLLRYLAHRLMRGITAFLQRVLRIIFIFKTTFKKCQM